MVNCTPGANKVTVALVIWINLLRMGVHLFMNLSWLSVYCNMTLVKLVQVISIHYALQIVAKYYHGVRV